jgi:hypothetical protein
MENARHADDAITGFSNRRYVVAAVTRPVASMTRVA